MIERRTVLAAAGVAIVTQANSAAAPYEVPPLGYDHGALAPVISRETMTLHHDKHHQAYVDALNRALADQPALQGRTVEELLRGLDQVPEAIRATVRNNGGGHANHQMFWKIMHPGGTAMPDGLQRQIAADFGSVDAMKAAFEAAGLRQFGSGWVFLVFDVKAQRTEIVALPNQDSVLLLEGKPALLGNDVWEHAYYLDYRNRRADYLKAWWGVVHWSYVGERLEGIRAGKTQL